MTPSSFVEAFVENRDVDGRRLFEYECEDDEYRYLVRSLSRYGDPGHLRVQVNGYGEPLDADYEVDWDDEAKQMMAAFVLFGSEWFIRHEPPPRRTWKRLLTAIGWTGDDYQSLYPGIVQGLRWWRTAPIRTPTKTLYFDTLAYQGGLSMDGLVALEFELASETEDHAEYVPTGKPRGFEAALRIRRSPDRPVGKRIPATFHLR